MFEFFSGLFDSQFMPHGHCYMWKPEILWLHVISDGLVTLSYFSIPFALFYFVRKRKDLVYRWIFLLFGAFILFCGATHALEIWTVWYGTYRLTGVVKLATGLVSISTAVVLWPLIPKALLIPSAQQLSAANEALQEEIEERKRIEEELRTHQNELEHKIKERTRDLEEVNLRTRMLINVTSQTGRTIDKQIEQALQITTEMLGLEMGIVSEIEDDNYTVISSYSSNNLIEPGQEFDLGKTFCHITMQTNDVVAVSNTQQSRYNNHPCYKQTKLESYIGVPLYKDSNAWGTINFSSSKPVSPPFGEIDRDFIRILAKWVSWMLEIKEKEKELERSNKELDNFAYVASHDLKAPLRAITNLAQWIEEDSVDTLPDAAQGYLAKMKNRIARMEALLNDLLEYARISETKSSTEDVDVQTLIEEVVPLLNIPETFTVDANNDLPIIKTSKTPLLLVFRNLIGNAIKHHDKEEGTIQITGTENGRLVEFAIQDDGPGIAPEFHENIFKMFTTLKPRDEVEGSGMGLAMVKKLVEYNGGQIRVESEEGEGTTFIFSWPKNN